MKNFNRVAASVLFLFAYSTSSRATVISGTVKGCIIDRGVTYSNESGYAIDDRFILLKQADPQHSGQFLTFGIWSNSTTTSTDPLVRDGRFVGARVPAAYFDWIATLLAQSVILQADYYADDNKKTFTIKSAGSNCR